MRCTVELFSGRFLLLGIESILVCYLLVWLESEEQEKGWVGRSDCVVVMCAKSERNEGVCNLRSVTDKVAVYSRPAFERQGMMVMSNAAVSELGIRLANPYTLCLRDELRIRTGILCDVGSRAGSLDLARGHGEGRSATASLSWMKGPWESCSSSLVKRWCSPIRPSRERSRLHNLKEFWNGL